ncbi:hypothetical protein E3U55_05165 [Filobacillus milosensis]|uniref:Flagellar hook-length control protein-like C-terminal domain-containing protein n=1 Tax=Filobacillus milosensis TaxID=94137 RepID=A0A4Y8ISU5_9BACI|nr:flagellar hook-length control protein FliK [Filobacillus milosensis]TFB23210.1 hypothetical protein E3U55_05165 [Filobacillus milosensis]
MNMAVATLLMGNAQQLTSGKNLSPNKPVNSFQQIISQVMTTEGESQTELLSQLKELLNLDLQTLFKSLEQGVSEEIPEKLSQQLVERFNELIIEFDGDLNNLMKDTLTQITSDFSVVDSEEQTVQVIGAFILNSMTQSDQKVNPITKPDALVQGERVLSKIVQMIKSPTDSSNQLQNNKIPLDIKIPDGWSKKWNELLTKLNQPTTKTQSLEMSLVSNRLVDSIKQLVTTPKARFELNQLNWTDISTNKNRSLQSQPVSSIDQSQINGQLTKQEQFIIHMTRPEQSTTSTTNQKQIIEQLQKIIQSTRFTQVGAQKQLSIQLKPANLGDMMLKFTQIDGQMAVKISVTTQAAKEMLEGNLQQLRHMFSPNQVVVERQVDQTNTDYTQQFTDKDESQQDQDSQEHAQDQTDSNEEQLEKSFSDYLFEEEV